MIDVLQRDLEGDGIAEVPQETAASQRSTPVAPRAVEVEGIAPRRPTRLVLVQGSTRRLRPQLTRKDPSSAQVARVFSRRSENQTSRCPRFETLSVRGSDILKACCSEHVPMC